MQKVVVFNPQSVTTYFIANEADAHGNFTTIINGWGNYHLSADEVMDIVFNKRAICC